MIPNSPPKTRLPLPNGEFVDINSGDGLLIKRIREIVDREAVRLGRGGWRQSGASSEGGQVEIDAQGVEQSVARGGGAVVDLGGFLARVGVRNVHTEIVTVVVYFYVVLHKRPSVTINDLWAAYRQQGWDYMPVFKAVERAASRHKWLMRTGKNVVVLTEEGKAYVDDLLRGIRPVTLRRGRRGQAAAVGSAVTLVKRDSLNLLGGDGREAFKALVKRIDVKSARQRIAICAWYLIQVLRQEKFDEHDVFTMFDHVGWPLPKNLRNSITNDARYYDLYSGTSDGKFRAKDNLMLYVRREILPEIGTGDR